MRAASVTFADGSVTTSVGPTGDAILEPNETVSHTLLADPACSIGTAKTAVPAISINDGRGSIPVQHYSTVETTRSPTTLPPPRRG